MTVKTHKVDFSFEFAGHGHYRVTFQSYTTGREWTKTISDMALIDAVKNEEYPLRKDLNELKRVVKQ